MPVTPSAFSARSSGEPLLAGAASTNGWMATLMEVFYRLPDPTEELSEEPLEPFSTLHPETDRRAVAAIPARLRLSRRGRHLG